MPAATPRPAKPSEARERLLATASELFYAEGINSVGVNRIVREGQVTLATFYRHFPSKDDLVVAYLQGIHDRVAERAAVLTGQASGRELVRALGDEVTAQLGRPAFRGCAFMNAGAEIEDRENPARRVVAEHREWYFQLARRAFSEAGHRHPNNAARHFVMLRDGSMSAASLDSPDTATRVFRRGVEGLIRSIDAVELGAGEQDEP